LAAGQKRLYCCQNHLFASNPIPLSTLLQTFLLPVNFPGERHEYTRHTAMVGEETMREGRCKSGRRATIRSAARALDRLIVLNLETAREARRVREKMLRLSRQGDARKQKGATRAD